MGYEAAMPFANVAIPTPVHGCFTYRVPEGMQLVPGTRVELTFRNRRTIGLCLEMTDAPPSEIDATKLKAVEQLLDEAPALSPALLELVAWMAEYYCAPIGEVCRAALPARMMKPGAPRTTRPTAPAEIGLPHTAEITLNEDQARALEAMIATADEQRFAPFLLHGITGSGKTEIYLRLFAELAARGRRGLLLVPEIALTPQLTARAGNFFGERIALLHSGLTDAQRHEQWRRAREGAVDLVIGTRSALFAPLPSLGAIVVDEEHDGSYKQDEGFAYSARDAAVMRAHIEGIPVVLGSATPSLESLVNAREGKYALFELPRRTGTATLPTVEIVDMRRARHREHDARSGETGGPQPHELAALSPTLYEALAETLARGEQALLFIGRRGFASSVHCEGCGAVFTCPNCDIALTAHLGRNDAITGRLVCHYCDHTVRAPECCAECGGTELTPVGHGSERLEAEIRDFFPKARVARLDSDMAGTGERRRRIFDGMRDGRYDILVGTQMITKGHDFPRVTLVGVVSADTLLGLPDFRSAERAFQLITQVAGRAGRGTRRGRVIVQSYQPEHPSLVAAAEHDLAAFAAAELDHRRALGYPPFARLAAVRLSSTNADAVERAARAVGDRLRAIAGNAEGIAILGPAPAPLAKIRGRLRWQLLIKAAGSTALARFLAQSRAAIAAAAPRNVRTGIDVDPRNML